MRTSHVSIRFDSFLRRSGSSSRLLYRYILQSKGYYFASKMQEINPEIQQTATVQIPAFVYTQKLEPRIELSLYTNLQQPFQINQPLLQDQIVVFQDQSQLKIVYSENKTDIPENMDIFQFATPIIQNFQLRLPISQDIKPVTKLLFESTSYEQVVTLKEAESRLEAEQCVFIDGNESLLHVWLCIEVASIDVAICDIQLVGMNIVKKQMLLNLVVKGLVLQPIFAEILDALAFETKFVQWSVPSEKVLAQIEEQKSLLLYGDILQQSTGLKVLKMNINQVHLGAIKQLQKLIFGKLVDSKAYLIDQSQVNVQVVVSRLQFNTRSADSMQEPIYHECSRNQLYPQSILSHTSPCFRQSNLQLALLSYPKSCYLVASSSTVTPQFWTGSFQDNAVQIQVQSIQQLSATKPLNHNNTYFNTLQQMSPFERLLNTQCVRLNLTTADTLYLTFYNPLDNSVQSRLQLPLSSFPSCSYEAELNSRDFVVQIKEAQVIISSKNLFTEPKLIKDGSKPDLQRNQSKKELPKQYQPPKQQEPTQQQDKFKEFKVESTIQVNKYEFKDEGVKTGGLKSEGSHKSLAKFKYDEEIAISPIQKFRPQNISEQQQRQIATNYITSEQEQRGYKIQTPVVQTEDMVIKRQQTRKITKFEDYKLVRGQIGLVRSVEQDLGEKVIYETKKRAERIRIINE
ncbi:Conserved_hypothetical protein [Hexamita inflata]|uniref:DUF2382 domain-containing protein n=1 Tax=Hexamita inflata TaxID=28002 RepID=A0ABP1HSF7_9EUKA